VFHSAQFWREHCVKIAINSDSNKMVEYTTHDIAKQPQLISFAAAAVYLKF
jgi:hypothetical protein